MALTSASGTVPDFAAVRAEFALPTGFPAAVLAEAAEAAARAATGDGRVDATDIELVTIDPPGAKDLDQALGITRRGDGFRVHYAIADLGAVVAPGGAIDAEVRKRGQTVYLPDGSVPLHPPVLSEGASSLLPDGPRPAVLWTIDLDATGERTAVDVRRATVRSRARLDYAGVQADIDAGRPHPAVAALPELGALRRALAVARGAIELELPDQEVVPDGAGGWTTRIRQRPPVENWNAEISLLTGTAAAATHAGRGRRGAAHAARARALGRGAAEAHGGDARDHLARRGHRRAGAVGPSPDAATTSACARAAPGGQHPPAGCGLRGVRPGGGHGTARGPRARRHRRAVRARHRSAAAARGPVRHGGLPRRRRGCRVAGVADRRAAHAARR